MALQKYRGCRSQRIISLPRSQLGFLNGEIPIKKKVKHLEELNTEDYSGTLPTEFVRGETAGLLGTKLGAAV